MDAAASLWPFPTPWMPALTHSATNVAVYKDKAITNDNSSGGILKPPSNLNDVFANCLSSGVSYPTLTPPNKNVKSGNINKIAIEMFKTGKCLPSFSLSFLAWILTNIIETIPATTEYIKISKFSQIKDGV